MSPEIFRQITDQITPDAVYFLPEIALAVTACLVLLLDLLLRQRDSRQLCWVALVGVAASAALLLGLEPFADARALFRSHAGGGKMADTGMIWWDGVGNLFKLVLLGGTAISILLTYAYRPMARMRQGEFLAVLLTSVVGMSLMATASDMLIFILGIEMASIPSYILVCYTKQGRKSAEAAMKYVIYGSVAGGVMIYGFSLLYGMTGTTQLSAIAHVAAVQVRDGMDLSFAIVLLLTLAGFLYKMSAFPFHFWAPDVYEGAPTPVTAFLATLSKLAGFAVFIRLLHSLHDAPGLVDFDFATIVAVISALTMTVGNLGALMQRDVKRMLAYSSIAHAGYLLMACTGLFAAVFDGGGYGAGYTGTMALGFYALIYLFMNFGAFAVLISVENATGGTDLEGFRGLARRAPLLAGAMAVFLVSLVGLPPTGGFVGKFGLFVIALDAGQSLLVLIAALNTVVSLAYYARILREMYLVPGGQATAPPASTIIRSLAVISAAVVLYLGVFFGGAVQAVGEMTFGRTPVVHGAAHAPLESAR